MSNAAIFRLKSRAWVAEEAFERLDPAIWYGKTANLELEVFEQDKFVAKVYDMVKSNSSIGHVGRSKIII